MNTTFPATCIALLVIAAVLALIGFWLEDKTKESPRRGGFVLWIAAVLAGAGAISLTHWFLSGGC